MLMPALGAIVSHLFFGDNLRVMGANMATASEDWMRLDLAAETPSLFED